MIETTEPALRPEPALSPEEVRLFGTQGFLGPFTLCPPEEIPAIREAIERDVLPTENPYSATPERDRFRDSRVVYDLCAHPEILERAACLLGPDLVLFASSFFAKQPGYPEFPWHADGPYWEMNPCIGLSAWIALHDATPENGCVELIPGSHRQNMPHEEFGYDRLSNLRRRMGQRIISGQRAVPRLVDDSRRVAMPIRAGQFFLFAESTLHRSGPNTTAEGRTGLAVRLTTPLARIRHERIHPRSRVLLVRGEDRFGWNQLGEPPA